MGREGEGSRRLREALRRLGAGRRAGAEGAPLHTGPASPFDALLEQRMQALERQVEELKGRVNGLVLTVVGAVVVQLILGFFR